MQKIVAYLLTPFASQRHCLIFAGVAMVVMGVALGAYPRLPPIHTDSASFIQFFSIRTALYPAFLDLFGGEALHNNQRALALIVTAQTTIYIVAMGFMMWGLATARLPIIALVLFLVAFAGNYQLHLYHSAILAESLGLSLVCFLIGCLALWFHTRHYRWLAAAMLVATLAFGLRPNMIAMPLGVAIVGLFHIIHTRNWKKPLLAIFVPFILVAGFESAYYHAHHQTRSDELLQRHMFGKAALVLAMNEAGGQRNRFYQTEFAPLKPFMQKFGGQFRIDHDRYWASGEDCVRLTLRVIYEDAAYWHFDYPPSTDWAWQVFATYPTTLAQVTAGHYLNFFCVGSITLAKTPIISGDLIYWQPHTPRPSERLFLQLIAWAFIALGIGFFVSKIYYGVRWVRRGLAFLPVPLPRWLPQLPALTSHEALGSTLIMLAFGYNLFIAIFGVTIVRFLIISYPLMILGILLMAVIIAQEILAKPTSS